MKSFKTAIGLLGLSFALVSIPATANERSPQSLPDLLPKPVCNQQAQGFVNLQGTQEVGYVKVRLDGVYVTAAGTYKVNVMVENGSNLPFSFVPKLNVELRDAATGQPVGAGLSFNSPTGVYLKSLERLRGELTVYSRCWQDNSPQGLILTIREAGTPGRRNFQISF